MIRHIGRIALVLIAMTLCAHASAQTLRVGSVTDTRFSDDWTLDGDEMINTRAKLLNPANFGPGGTFSRPIVITDTGGAVGSITPALLANFDVFFIGYLDDANPNAFTAAELNAMQSFVNSGGTLIVTCDDNNYDAVCSFFGHPATAGSPGINPTVPTAAGSASPLFNGPFGVVTAINESGTQGAFTNTTGATVLATDSTPGTPLPDVLIQTIGAGRVILLADVDMIANAASAGPGIGNQNDQFLGNLFAFAPALAPVVLAPVPMLSPLSVMLLALCVAAIGLYLRRRHPRA